MLSLKTFVWVSCLYWTITCLKLSSVCSHRTNRFCINQNTELLSSKGVSVGTGRRQILGLQVAVGLGARAAVQRARCAAHLRALHGHFPQRSLLAPRTGDSDNSSRCSCFHAHSPASVGGVCNVTQSSHRCVFWRTFHIYGSHFKNYIYIYTHMHTDTITFISLLVDP